MSYVFKGDLKEKIPKITFIFGILLLLLSFFIPYRSLEFILGEGLRPLGLVSIFINPILGILGLIFSLITKKWLFAFLNLLLIFNFFIIMSIIYRL